MLLSKKQLKEYIFKEYVDNDCIDRGLSKRTNRNRRDCLKRFYKYLGSKSFTADNCRGWMRSLSNKGLKPNSIKDTGRILRATIRFLFRRKVIKDDFASDIPLPKIPKTNLAIVPAELAEKIIIAGTEPGPGDNCLNRERKKEYRVALRFILRTGLRNREARDLRGSDINLEDETYLVQSKSGNLDRMPLPKDMIKEIGQRVNNGQLFPNLRAERLNICLNRGSGQLGVKTRVRVHTLRHIFCTTLLKKGVPLQIVSRLMRHASVAITDSVYSHYLIDDLKQSLNERHPLIFKSLSSDEIFQSVRRSVQSIIPDDDKRFEVQIRSDRIIIKVI